MRGPYHKLHRRLLRAGYGYILGAGDEPDVSLYEKVGRNGRLEGKQLWLVRTRGENYVILKKRPPMRQGLRAKYI